MALHIIFLLPIQVDLEKWGGAIRNFCFRRIVKKCGSPINIESHAHFGNGLGIELGNHSCIGIKCHVPKDVWIGRQVLFTPCKSVGNHVVIGAGSVVSKNIPDNVIVGGNPVRIIRQRWNFENDEEFRKQ